MVPKGLVRRLEKQKSGKYSETTPNDSITKIAQKSPRDLSGLAVAQTPMKDYKQTLE